MKKRTIGLFLMLAALIILLPTVILAADVDTATVIYKDGTREKSVQVSAGLDGSITVTLPETVTAAGLQAKTGYSLAAWVVGDSTEYEPGETIALAKDSVTTLTVKWSLDAPTINVLRSGSTPISTPSSGVYTGTYEEWITSGSNKWVYRLTVSHPLQGEDGLTCHLYFNGEPIHTGTTNWWVSDDSLSVLLNTVADSGSYWFVAKQGEYTSAPSEVKVVEIKPATLTVTAKNQAINIGETVNTAPGSATISVSSSSVAVDDVVGAVSLELGNRIGDGRYQICVVVRDANAVENYVLRAGSPATLTVTGTPTVTLANQSMPYTGSAVVPDPTKVTIEGYDDLGTPPQASSVTYRYFSDADCSSEIPAPAAKGTYYVKAYTPAKNAYLAAESNAATITIENAVLNVTPKSWEIPVGAGVQGVSVETMQTDGVKLGADFADWVDWDPQNDGTAAEVAAFLSSENLVLKLGPAADPTAAVKTYPIYLAVANEAAAGAFREGFELTLNQTATLQIKPIPTLTWVGDAADGQVSVEYTGEDLALPANLFVVTDGGSPAAEASDGKKDYAYYAILEMNGAGATDPVKAWYEAALDIRFGTPFPLTPGLPADVFLTLSAAQSGIDLAGLAEQNIFVSLRYIAVPTYTEGSIYADATGTPLQVNIVPAVVEITALPQTLKCTDPLIGIVERELAAYGEFVLDSSTFPMVAELSKGPMTSDLADAVANGSLSITLGEKTPAGSEHSYTQPIRIGYSSNVTPETLATIPLLYDVRFVPGTLSVSQHVIELTWSGTDDRVADDGKTATAEIASGIDSNAPDVRVTVSGGDETAAGDYTAVATLEGADAAHYVIADGQAEKAYTIAGKNAPVVVILQRYTVKIAEDIHGGTVIADGGTMRKGSTVTVTVIPDEGYALDSLTVTDSKNGAIAVIKLSETEYRFTMPAYGVVIDAEFAELDRPCDGGTSCPLHSCTDLVPDAWYHDGIHYCLEHGLMEGTGPNTFAPKMTTSRAMIVTVLWRLEGKPVVNYAMDFDDVAADQWYTEAVRWAASEGIVEGYGDGRFDPLGEITREQTVTILWRYAKYKGVDVSGADADLDTFGDSADVSDWAVAAMQWACDVDVIRGVAADSSVSLAPQSDATRAESATILQRYCENVIGN